MAGFNKLLPGLSKARGLSRRRQAGFVRLSMNLARWGKKKFTVRDLFAQGEPGAHFEVYDPNTLLQRRNQLTYSRDFSNAAWVKKDSTVVGQKVIPSAVNTTHGITRSNLSSGALNVFSIRARADGYNWMAVQFGNVLTWFNLQAGAVGNIGAGLAASITDAGSGYYDCVVSGTAANNNSQIYVATANAVVSFAGDGVSGILVERAQVEWNTTTPTEYQEVTDWNTEYLAAALDRVGTWQDSTGTTPVTAVEQPVGMWRDTKRGLDASVGPELYVSAAGAGAVTINTNGSIVIGGDGSITCTAVAAGIYGVKFNNLVPALGTTYRTKVSVVTNSLGRNMQSDYGGRIASLGTSAGDKLQHYIGTVSANAYAIYITAVGAGEQFTIKPLSAREVAGNHATQSGSTSRPILSARYNQFTKSEQFDDAAWAKSNSTITANQVTAPDGTMSADLMLDTATSAPHRVTGSVAVVSGSAMVLYIRFKQHSSGRNMEIGFVSGGTFVSNVVDASNGAVLSATDNLGTVFSNRSISVSGPDAYGFYTAKLTATITGVSTVTTIYGMANGTSVTYLGDGTGGIYIWGADVRTASDAALNQPAYQRVNTSTDYDTAGFIHYLKFDGTDDSLATGNIDFSGGDKMTVWVGITRLSDAAAGVVAGLGASDAGATPGAFGIYSPSAAASQRDLALVRGDTNFGGILADVAAAPASSVLTARFDLAGATVPEETTLRRNGTAQATTNGSVAGSGNFSNNPLYLGRRGGISLPFNGRMTSFTVRGSTTPASVRFLKEMEQYASRLAGQVFVST